MDEPELCTERRRDLGGVLFLGYVYAMCVAMPAFTGAALAWALLGHVQVGVTFTVLGAFGTWLAFYVALSDVWE